MLKYPCIVYKRDSGDSKFADDAPYSFKVRYQIIYIDPNPDSEMIYKLAMLPGCVYERHYPADNLNHDVFLKY